MTDRQHGLEQLLKLSRIVAVLVIDDAATAVPLARALVKGGIRLIEITLRTPAALDAIRRIAGEVEGAVIGAGTILTPEQFAEVDRIGCRFIVSPGATPRLIEAAAAAQTPWLPAAATVSEMLLLLEHGYRLQKFFPAEPAGGATYLKSLASPLSPVRFCPTGGIDERNFARYLELPNVLCVGGSWIAPPGHVRAGDWDAVAAHAAKALGVTH
ncbi:MAG: bifunctional 4-hydroxy-2-oxoglutarate aldolase/2-dehydro-3-deoxy-phosphogluconate aldolase [Aestuariivirgaceae bacterium]